LVCSHEQLALSTSFIALSIAGLCGHTLQPARLWLSFFAGSVEASAGKLHALSCSPKNAEAPEGPGKLFNHPSFYLKSVCDAIAVSAVAPSFGLLH
jgi:hypothetical protein